MLQHLGGGRVEVHRVRAVAHHVHWVLLHGQDGGHRSEPSHVGRTSKRNVRVERSLGQILLHRMDGVVIRNLVLVHLVRVVHFCRYERLSYKIRECRTFSGEISAMRIAPRSFKA